MAPCNCRRKNERRLNGKYRAKISIYKYAVSATDYPKKVYSGNAEYDFKRQYIMRRYYECVISALLYITNIYSVYK